jgi:hypothetical protein
MKIIGLTGGIASGNQPSVAPWQEGAGDRRGSDFAGADPRREALPQIGMLWRAIFDWKT